MRYSLLVLLVSAVTFTTTLPANAGGAHCYCKLGPLGAPIQNFGEIDHYGTQIGHDSACSNLCITKSDAYMASNQAAACAASHGGTIVAYSAVGTKSYQTAKNYNCPQSNPTPPPASFLFGTTPATSRSLHVNSASVNMYSPSGQTVNVQNSTPFTRFELDDFISGHAQQWTYEAKLYRDNQLVENLSKKSPPLFAGSVLIAFTGQPNAFVHGHTWKVEWHYFGPNFTNGSVSFFIP